MTDRTPEDDGYQPLPDLDNLHAPDTVLRKCATCGRQHEAVLSGYRPLGDMNVELLYRMPPCPDNLAAEPLPGPVPDPMLETTPHVWHDEEDGT